MPVLGSCTRKAYAKGHCRQQHDPPSGFRTSARPTFPPGRRRSGAPRVVAPAHTKSTSRREGPSRMGRLRLTHRGDRRPPACSTRASAVRAGSGHGVATVATPFAGWERGQAAAAGRLTTLTASSGSRTPRTRSVAVHFDGIKRPFPAASRPTARLRLPRLFLEPPCACRKCCASSPWSPAFLAAHRHGRRKRKFLFRDT